MRTWPESSTFTGDSLRRVALPLGGIGTGTVSLGGRGDLRDWELMDVPAKGLVPCADGVHPHIALRTVDDAGRAVLRLCEGPLDDAAILDAQGMPASNHGWPRFAACRATATYPFMRIGFDDPALPLAVHLEAFNPLIPGDLAASSLPLAVLRIVVANPGPTARPVTLCMGLPNFVGLDGTKRRTDWDGRSVPIGPAGNRNQLRDADGLSGLVLDSRGVDPADPAWGEMALAVMGGGRVTRRTHWAKGTWGAALLDYWDDLLADGALDDRPDRSEDMPCAALACERMLPPGGASTFTFLLAWRFPNRRSWTADAMLTNHYATVWPSAWSVLEDSARSLPRLEDETIGFVRSIVDSDLPRPIADAALSNLATLRSQTCFRLPDGRLAGWEGVHDVRGSCHGSCTHVWNYEHVTAHLFPELARGMREIEFEHATDARGCMAFRVSLPLDREHLRKAAADGQLGCLVRLWREWRQGAGDEWLARIWPKARLAMEWCWIAGGWDGDRDGVMEGCQHNTMDVEYYGPNPQMQGWYLAALRACELMARHLGDDAFADRCRSLFQAGSSWMDRELWNGRWYEQRFRHDLAAEIPSELILHGRDDGSGDLQLAGGCLVDQLVGQALAGLYGLGTLHQAEHVERTLASIASLNRRDRTAPNPMRSFAFDDEPALIMAHYPPGSRPRRPFPYFAEVMTGFEYTAAIGMVQAGMDELAVRTVADVRRRHDGRRRNPFSEPECGHHYVRAMASWGVLLAWTGQRWDAPSATLHLGARQGRYPWCAGDAWGWWRFDGRGLHLHCAHGALPLARIAIAGRMLAAEPLASGGCCEHSVITSP